eukprot:6331895-Pyramimonas_sp.AAC.1
MGDKEDGCTYSSSDYMLAQLEVPKGGIWNSTAGCVMTGHIKRKRGESLAGPLETLLEHIVRVAGGTRRDPRTLKFHRFPFELSTKPRRTRVRGFVTVRCVYPCIQKGGRIPNKGPLKP